ncbi:hypothetical protein TS65_28085 [Aneurinibacillus migulanus]|uniref:Uncharacterized protein n=1 Tax=Aneurinibacillus migulanus TaxID=47500 RepID=A0A0D1UW17_ANEMI|nr:hypothetical protein TS65_28085 [Aneurinibacillus migulanus]KON94712.1 hypothetical protein AF333_03655 [Aneurinibacillus migulanus]
MRWVQHAAMLYRIKFRFMTLKVTPGRFFVQKKTLNLNPQVIQPLEAFAALLNLLRFSSET